MQCLLKEQLHIDCPVAAFHPVQLEKNNNITRASGAVTKTPCSSVNRYDSISGFQKKQKRFCKTPCWRRCPSPSEQKDHMRWRIPRVLASLCSAASSLHLSGTLDNDSFWEMMDCREASLSSSVMGLECLAAGAAAPSG